MILSKPTSILRLVVRYKSGHTGAIPPNLKPPKQLDRVLTVPNVLTLSRIAASPAMAYFICNGMHSQALACFAIAASTDFLDGFAARQLKQQSDLGSILDPIADKLLLTTCFVTMYNTELLPLWLIKGFILRDLMILGGGAIIRYYGFDEKPGIKKFFNFSKYPTLGFEPTLTSKVNTALQCSIILAALSPIPLYDWATTTLHVSAAMTTAYSAGQYFQRLYTHPFDIKPARSKLSQ